MVLAGLVRAGRVRHVARLVSFFALGAVLAFVRGQWVSPELPVVRVTVPPGASEAERSQAVDEAVLVELGLAAGWVETDPLILDRLRRNVGFIDADVPPEGALAHALALGMERTDPIVRLRLVSRARAMLDAPLESADPGDAVLDPWLAEQRERFDRPAKLELSQVFLSRERRGAALRADAAALLDRLRTEEPEPKRAARLGDPLLILRSVEVASPRKLDGDYGEGFGQALLAAEAGVWSGPHRSRFGLHLVWVHRRQPPESPGLETIRAEVLTAWREANRAGHRADRLAMARAGFDVRVEEAP